MCLFSPPSSPCEWVADRFQWFLCSPWFSPCFCGCLPPPGSPGLWSPSSCFGAPVCLFSPPSSACGWVSGRFQWFYVLLGSSPCFGGCSPLPAPPGALVPPPCVLGPLCASFHRHPPPAAGCLVVSVVLCSPWFSPCSRGCLPPPAPPGLWSPSLCPGASVCLFSPPSSACGWVSVLTLAALVRSAPGPGGYPSADYHPVARVKHGAHAPRQSSSCRAGCARSSVLIGIPGIVLDTQHDSRNFLQQTLCRLCGHFRRAPAPLFALL